MSAAIGIVAHAARISDADELANQVDAAYMSVDDGTLGCDANHRKVWQHLSRYNTDWTLVLEDDAQPVQGFRNQARQALNASPCDIVSFYLGHPDHWSGPMNNRRELLLNAGQQATHHAAHWIITQELLHGVAVAIRTEHVPNMLRELNNRPIDYAIRDWAHTTNRNIAFSWPSLADHKDGPTLANHCDGTPRTTPRKAWQLGTRHHWTSKAVSP